ncbi:MAG TPA: bifunctional pyr operon transcriptional regulator/uracil phosphoribosyltransferase, partial [Lapillicoccus sp.]|nr:bifunctional pyr operon transcriptional regulator/uracil phosphoribosyltransferase [Lapillicoccus sp.]
MAAAQPARTDQTAREVLTSGDVSRALRRIAHEILERNKGADDLVL